MTSYEAETRRANANIRLHDGFVCSALSMQYCKQLSKLFEWDNMRNIVYVTPTFLTHHEHSTNTHDRKNDFRTLEVRPPSLINAQLVLCESFVSHGSFERILFHAIKLIKAEAKDD